VEARSRLDGGGEHHREWLAKAYDAFGARLFRHAVMITARRDLAEDAVQECFADLYLHRSSYRPDFSFSTFLGALIRHKSIDILRKLKHQPFPVQEMPEIKEVETPESLCIRKEIYTGLNRALNELPSDQREMLLLFALHGMDYQQIAKELHKSIPQVKIGLHRIRKKLKKAKEDWT
jgi:RNA polymerase sigma-70 factor (ECF subfamily)